MKADALVLVLALAVAACGREGSPEAHPPEAAARPAGPAPAGTAGPAGAEVEQAPARLARLIGGEGAFDGAHEETLVAVFTPDGACVLTAGLEGKGRLFDLEGHETATLDGHVGSIHAVAFSPDGSEVVTASVDHTARAWSLGDGRLEATIPDAEAEVADVAFAPDGERFLVLGLDGVARVAHSVARPGAAPTARRYAPMPLKRGSQEAPVSRAAWAPDSTLLTIDTDGHLYAQATDRPDARPPSPVPLPDGTVVSALRVQENSRASRWLALTEGPTAWLGGGPHLLPLEGHDAQVLDAAFSPDGTLVATASLDSTARLFDVKDGRTVSVLRGHGASVFSVSFSPDGTHLLTVSSDRTARLWDREGNTLAVFGSKADPVVAASFSPKGDRVLTLPYRAGRARIFDLRGRLRVVLPDATGRLSSASWSPDEKRVLAIDRDDSPRLYLVEEEKLSPAPSGTKGTGSGPASPASPKRDYRGDYAGTVACARCHRKAYVGWAASSHAKTSLFADEDDLPADVLAGKTVEHPPGETTFGRYPNGGWYAETTGDSGKKERFPLDYVSGHNRVRFFMTRFPDGRIQVLPPMYEVTTGKWFDWTALVFGAPGTDFDTPPVVKPGDRSWWTGPVRSWDGRCAQCHMSGKRAVRPKNGVGPRTIWRAYAVDCEACHGPGRLHAEAWSRLEMNEPLPRLETLSRNGRTAVCTHCHQEGELLDPPFELGEDLYRYIDPTLLLDPERVDPAGRSLELIYDGLPFSTSDCANHAGFTCSTCHAPHGSRVRSLLRHTPEHGSFCTPCHQKIVDAPEAHTHHDAGSPGNECVLCHMPFLTIERGHGAVADHTIGIPRLGLEADRVTTDACTWCHTGGRKAPPGVPALDADALASAYRQWWTGRGWPQPWMASLARARRGDPGRGPDLGKVARDRTLPREVRASAALLLERYAEDPGVAGTILAVSHDPDDLVRRSAVKALRPIRTEAADGRLLEALADESFAVRSAAARTALDGFARVQANRPLLEAAVPVLEEEARRVPDDDQRWFRLGAAYDILDRPEKALEAYEREVELDPFASAVKKEVKNLKALLGKDG